MAEGHEVVEVELQLRVRESRLDMVRAYGLPVEFAAAYLAFMPSPIEEPPAKLASLFLALLLFKLYRLHCVVRYI